LHWVKLRLIRAVKARIDRSVLGTSSVTFFYIRILVVLRFFIRRSRNIGVLGGVPILWLAKKLSEHLRAHGPGNAGSSWTDNEKHGIWVEEPGKVGSWVKDFFDTYWHNSTDPGPENDWFEKKDYVFPRVKT